jgi:heme exporter protein A
MLFRDLSFRVEAGSVLAIEGANGAGKTSLLRMIAGFLAPAAGTIRLATEGGEIADSEERGRLIGFLAHQDGVKPQLTAAENLSFFARLYGARCESAAALDAVGLLRAGDVPGQYLSAGQKKRLALARLKSCARPLWLLDEPLASLDAQGKALVRELVAAHCAGGGIVLAATHEPLGLDCAKVTL